jgi:hypothetical protein
LVTAAAYFPDCRETEAHGNASQRPAAATSSTLGPDFRAQARASSPSRQVSPPFTCLVQPLKAAPRSGHGRLPKAPRVHACEAWPRAPHQPVWVSPFQPALTLPHFSNASRSAPHWTGHEQDKAGLGDGDRYTFTSS